MLKRLMILLVVLLAVAAVTTTAALGAVRVHGTRPALLQRSALGTNWRSDLERRSAACYDSDGSVPIYLVNKLAGFADGSIAGLAYSNDGPGCATHIELDRQVYNDTTVYGKTQIRAHEMDHLRGWTHTEGHDPNHNGTRESGENAAYQGGRVCYCIDRPPY